MKKTLVLLDVKQYMFIGQAKTNTLSRGVIEDNNMYRPNEIIVGSLSYLLDAIISWSSNEGTDVVLCFDSTPDYKREIMETVFSAYYKGGRAKAPDHVTYQYDLAKEVFPQIGINCLIHDGLEADDLIANAVFLYKNYYDNIIIMTNDSDQYYLVDEKTICQSIRRNGPTVTMQNYVYTCKKGVETPYNCSMVMKLLYAETSDNVPALPEWAQKKLVDGLSPKVYPLLGNIIALRQAVSTLLNDDEECMAIYDLIAPILVFDGSVKIDVGKEIDQAVLRYYATRFDCRGFRSSAPGAIAFEAYSKGAETLTTFLDKVNRR